MIERMSNCTLVVVTPVTDTPKDRHADFTPHRYPLMEAKLARRTKKEYATKASSKGSETGNISRVDSPMLRQKAKKKRSPVAYVFR